MARRRSRRRPRRRRTRRRRTRRSGKKRRRRTRRRRGGKECPKYNGTGRGSRGQRVYRVHKEVPWYSSCKYYNDGDPNRHFSA